jgi:hypothetical protein
VNRCVTARHVAEQTEQGGFAFIITAEFVWLHLFGMPVGKGMVPVIEVGAIPLDAVVIEPDSAEFGLETFAEAAFGLRIDVDAFGNVGIHMNCSVSLVVRFGCLKTDFNGNGDVRDCGRLAATSGRVG